MNVSPSPAGHLFFDRLENPSSKKMSLFGDARIKVSEIQMCGTDNLDIYFPKEGVSKIVAKE